MCKKLRASSPRYMLSSKDSGEISLHKEKGGKPGLKVKTGDALTDWRRTGVGQFPDQSAQAEPVTQLHETCINTGTAVQLDSDAHTRSQKLTCFCVDDFHSD